MNGRYLYAIVLLPQSSEQRERLPTSLGKKGIGGRGDEVYLVQHHNIGIFLSASPTEPYSLSRENLLTHERILEELLAYYTLLPMQFSTIAESEEEVRCLLEREYERFYAMLEQLQGKKELGLKAIFHERIFQEIAEKSDPIRRKKAEIERIGATQAALIEIGKMVEAALEAEKQRYRTEILSSLRPLALQTVENKLIGDRMLLNAAFLVDVRQETAFDEKVRELGKALEDKVKFKYVGNVP
ncbi:MAG: GvpL/GvpF family gas vesicle protein, partial [Chloroherpetonaceae bacterium]|nr:GvpL/GvpF family gas vesicle protein [Chloroherpetonaceae bacterium]